MKSSGWSWNSLSWIQLGILMFTEKNDWLMITTLIIDWCDLLSSGLTWYLLITLIDSRDVWKAHMNSEIFSQKFCDIVKVLHCCAQRLAVTQDLLMVTLMALKMHIPEPALPHLRAVFGSVILQLITCTQSLSNCCLISSPCLAVPCKFVSVWYLIAVLTDCFIKTAHRFYRWFYQSWIWNCIVLLSQSFVKNHHLRIV